MGDSTKLNLQLLLMFSWAFFLPSLTWLRMKLFLLLDPPQITESSCSSSSSRTCFSINNFKLSIFTQLLFVKRVTKMRGRRKKSGRVKCFWWCGAQITEKQGERKKRLMKGVLKFNISERNLFSHSIIFVGENVLFFHSPFFFAKLFLSFASSLVGLVFHSSW